MSDPHLNLIKNLDYSIVQQCMHCGLCLPSCPTYDATHLERHSPRGRIALIRAVADDELELSPIFAEEMYFCLGCLACTSACPAGVNYAELFERARTEVEAQGVLRRPLRNLIRRFGIHWLFNDLRRLRLLGRCIRLYQRLGLQSLIRRCGILRLFPARLRDLESLTPVIEPKFSHELIQPSSPPVGEKRYRVAMLTGCAQDLIYSQVNRDTVDVLVANGCEVITPALQSCCGSLHSHNGELSLARDMARRQLDQFPPQSFDAIISNAGGCGSHLKHLSRLLGDDPRYRARAEEWDRKLKDIHEWLVEIGFRAPTPDGGRPARVSYHDSCHLFHGQGVHSQPRTILQAIPGLTLIELPESTWCCGSAGVYNLVQPEMADALLQRKINRIKSTDCDVVAAANPGCLLQLQNGLRLRGDNTQVVHTMSLLAEAYRAEATLDNKSQER